MTIVRWNQARRWLGRALVVTGPAFVLQPSVAEACSCVASTVESSYGGSSDVLSAIPLFGYCTASEQHYIAHVTAAFKGCADPDQLVILTTPPDSAACGAELELGTEYLINAERAGTFFGVPKLSFNLCGYNLPTADLTAHDRTFLDGRTVCCGGECQCADGTQPVLCFANPCDVTAACDEAARCEANYCGGCNAEFYDEAGNAVCQAEPPGCGSDTDCVQTGCSGQICAAQEVITTCEFREEYACYQDPAVTTCGCNDGQCAFAPTPELAACLEEAGSPP
jgi:eight-cysteine-cluster-containing protein